MRAQRAVLILTVLGAGARSVVACSDDKPPAADVSSSSGGPSGRTAAATDASGDGGDPSADDAADGQTAFDAGDCLGDQPAEDGGFPACPDSGTCVTHCNNIVAHYRLGLAQVAVGCILKLPSCSDPFDVNLCVDNALGRACKDPSSPGYCAPLVTPCDPNAGGPSSLIDEQGCETFGNGLSAAGRDALASCIKSKIDAGTCPSDVRLCTDEIRQ